jgi:hypothetical protein
LHWGQIKSIGGMGKAAFNLILEGTISQAIFQRKSFSLSLSLSFQRSFQWLGVKGEETGKVGGESRTTYKLMSRLCREETIGRRGPDKLLKRSRIDRDSRNFPYT